MLKKTIALAVAAFMLAVVATPASAQTLESLQATIAALQAQIAALTGGSTTTTTGGYQFTRDLTIGSTGADVVALQDILISGGHLVMPAGVAKGYFGTLTQSAVAKWQASAGISPAAGYFGPISRAKLNASAGTTTGGGSTTGGTTGGSTTLQGGAGDITVTERSSGVEDEVLEGEEDVKVLGFEVEADGSDIAITSVRVEFEHDGNGSDRLDRYVDEVSIMLGNKVVGTADVDDFNESSDVYSRNIAISNAVVDEDETARFYVAVTAANNIDSDDLSEDWEVALGQIRFEDATGAILTDNTGTGVNGSIAETFSFEDLASSGDIQLTVREDDEDINDARTVQVDDTSDTNDVELLSFTIEAEGSDISLNEIVFDITSSGAGVTEIANDFRLLMDDEEVGRVTIDAPASGATGFASNTDASRAITITDLDDDDVVIDEGDTVSFMLVADINDIDGAFTNGDSLSVSLDSDDIDAEDENGDDVTDLSGTVESGPISFSAAGLMTDDGSKTATRVYNLDTTSSDDQGEFIVEFDVTAFEDPAFIALTGAISTSTNPASAGVYAYVENTSDVAQFTGTTTITVERVSGGSLSGNYVKVNAGQTATLRARVMYDAATAGNYRAQIHAVNFAETAVAGTSQQLTVPEADYQSPSVQILN